MKYLLLFVLFIVSTLSLAEDDESSYITFLHKTAKNTAAAEGPFPDAVKFLALGINSDGEAVVKAIWVSDVHWTTISIPEDIKALAHFHNSKMESEPEQADFSYDKCLKLYCFIVSSDGKKIWEISIDSGGKKYRDVSTTSYGSWQNARY